MTDNWIDSFNCDLRPPDTVSEAVDKLLLILSDDQKDEIRALKEDDLIDLHFGLGLAIRNAFGLHDLDSKLLADCGTKHPDDAAGVVVSKLWAKLLPHFFI